jgi:hypothetical protein
MVHYNAGVYFYAGVGGLIAELIASEYLKTLVRNLLYPRIEKIL